MSGTPLGKFVSPHTVVKVTWLKLEHGTQFIVIINYEKWYKLLDCYRQSLRSIVYLIKLCLANVFDTMQEHAAIFRISTNIYSFKYLQLMYDSVTQLLSWFVMKPPWQQWFNASGCRKAPINRSNVNPNVKLTFHGILFVLNARIIVLFMKGNHSRRW